MMQNLEQEYKEVWDTEVNQQTQKNHTLERQASYMKIWTLKSSTEYFITPVLTMIFSLTNLENFDSKLIA